jgi:hypothetical protein
LVEIGISLLFCQSKSKTVHGVEKTGEETGTKRTCPDHHRNVSHLSAIMTRFDEKIFQKAAHSARK